eukprot:5044301-Amphidinium_carterae.2
MPWLAKTSMWELPSTHIVSEVMLISASELRGEASNVKHATRKPGVYGVKGFGEVICEPVGGEVALALIDFLGLVIWALSNLQRPSDVDDRGSDESSAHSSILVVMYHGREEALDGGITGLRIQPVDNRIHRDGADVSGRDFLRAFGYRRLPNELAQPGQLLELVGSPTTGASSSVDLGPLEGLFKVVCSEGLQRCGFLSGHEGGILLLKLSHDLIRVCVAKPMQLSPSGPELGINILTVSDKLVVQHQATKGGNLAFARDVPVRPRGVRVVQELVATLP